MTNGCPHTDCTCTTKCLRAHCPPHALHAYDKALGTTPTKLTGTAPQPQHNPCTGGYTCTCPNCNTTRATITPQGAGTASPFRHAA